MGLRAGAASRDITPELRGDFFGYVRPDLRVRGVALRLHAHALVLDDGRSRVALLTLDLGAPLVTDALLEILAPAGFGPHNLLIAATHTHAGPNRPGAGVARRAADAVLAAEAGLRPARATWADAEVPDANHNRSLEAHLANHGLDLYPGTGANELDPHGDDHPRDTTLRLLRVEDLDGGPLAAWAHFSAHPTTFGPANTTFSADYPRTAIHHFRAGFDDVAPRAIVTNGTEGDLIPRYDDVSHHALADRIGRRVADAMRSAWESAGARMTDQPEVTVDGTARHIAYRGQEVAPGRRVGDRAWFGLPFLGGAENGPSFLYGLGLEGRRRPRWLAGSVHGRKLVAAPAPHPTDAEVTVLRLGDRLLLGVPGEPTVEAGRRMRSAALRRAGPEVADALVVGLVHRYRGYFTTPEEYDQQHYEGGHTVFGKHTSLLIEQTHAELAAALSGRTGPRQVTGPAPAPAATAGRRPPAPQGSRRLRVRRQPPARVPRLEVVTVSWLGARRGRDRPHDAPFVVVQLAVDGRWADVDDDLGIGLVWHQRGTRLTARYEVPADASPGIYRIEVRGVRATAATDAFEVVASSDLRVRGVTATPTGLAFRAQHPPPDPTRHLRARDVDPRGGTLRFLADGQSHVAVFDAAARAWTADLPVAPRRVHVPPNGLADDHGNRSGAAVDLAVGELAEIDWPPPIGPGGGRSPGPFGLGPAGQVAPWPRHDAR